METIFAGRGDLVVGRSGARFLGRRMACSIGRGGIGVKAGEGDGATPAGAWRLVGGFWRADRMARPATSLPLAPIGPRDMWSDDPSDPLYNHLCAGRWRRFSAERMARADPQYDFVLATDFNWPDATPGAGSAIFLHVWRGPSHATAGCVAFARRDLLWIAARWRPGARLLVQS